MGERLHGVEEPLSSAIDRNQDVYVQPDIDGNGDGGIGDHGDNGDERDQFVHKILYSHSLQSFNDFKRSCVLSNQSHALVLYLLWVICNNNNIR